MHQDSYAIYETTGYPGFQGALNQLSDALYRTGHREASIKVDELQTAWAKEMNGLAVTMAGASEGYMVRKLMETAAPLRPRTGNLESHIKSEPGPLALVRVGLIEELDKVVNPNTPSFGPFWPAIEWGTGGDGIPSLAGRVLYGVFTPSGLPPDAAQRSPKGTDRAFEYDAGRGLANSGFGTVADELPARHFLRDGAAQGAARYLERGNEICEKYMAEVRGIVERAVATPPVAI